MSEIRAAPAEPPTDAGSGRDVEKRWSGSTLQPSHDSSSAHPARLSGETCASRPSAQNSSIQTLQCNLEHFSHSARAHAHTRGTSSAEHRAEKIHRQCTQLGSELQTWQMYGHIDIPPEARTDFVRRWSAIGSELLSLQTPFLPPRARRRTLTPSPDLESMSAQLPAANARYDHLYDPPTSSREVQARLTTLSFLRRTRSAQD